jgi:hypothetical protein
VGLRVRKRASIKDPTKKLTWYCFMHSFNLSTRSAFFPEVACPRFFNSSRRSLTLMASICSIFYLFSKKQGILENGRLVYIYRLKGAKFALRTSIVFCRCTLGGCPENNEFSNENAEWGGWKERKKMRRPNLFPALASSGVPDYYRRKEGTAC